MRVFLDTTYFIPSIGVALPNLPWDIAFRVQRNAETVISDLTLFELYAKGAKYVKKGFIEKEQVLRGVTSLRLDERFQKVDYWDSMMQDTAISLRQNINDYLDCILLASAIHSSEVMLTEDMVLRKAAEDNRGLISKLNSGFQVKNWNQVKELYK